MRGVVADALLLLSVLVLGREVVRIAQVVFPPVVRVVPWIVEGAIAIALTAWLGGR